MITEVNRYIKLWQHRCYSELPDEAPREIDDMVPSYRKIVICILKNDLLDIGTRPKVSEFYGMLKAIELGVPYRKTYKKLIPLYIQLSLF